MRDDTETIRCEIHCPVCGGPAVSARTSRLCKRCGFVMCEGCEAEDANVYHEAEAA